MYGTVIKPLKGISTRWINQKVCGMGCLVEKFSLYIQHLTEVIPTIKNSKKIAIAMGKLNNLVKTKVLLWLTFFQDVLAEEKRFSIVTQEKNINVIRMLDALETIKSNYEQFLKKVKNPAYIFQLPNLKFVIDAINVDDHEDGEPK